MAYPGYGAPQIIMEMSCTSEGYPGYGQPPMGYPGAQVDPLWGYFSAVAGQDQQIDAVELQRCLTSSGLAGSYQQFNLDTCRIMICMLDRDYSGKMGFTEFKELWTALNQWKNTFVTFDRDRSGTVEPHELHQAIISWGYNLSPQALNIIVKRYSDSARIKFDDFVAAAIRLRMITDHFRRRDTSQTGHANFTYDDFIQVTMHEDEKSSSDNILRKVILPSNLDAYEIGCKIGAGTLGLSSLWFAKQKDGHEQLVIRKISIDKLSSQALQELQGEMNLSSKLVHPGVLSIYSSFVVKHHLFTVFPMFNYGSCWDLISAEFHRGLPVLLVSMVTRSIVLALEYLHEMHVIHRAVKASHILLSSGGGVCLSGLRYGIISENSSVAHSYPLHAAQMLQWIAPEILKQNLLGYSYPSDIYSLGITVCELMTGNVPFAELRPTEILYQKLCGVIPQLPNANMILDLQPDVVNSQNSLDRVAESENTTIVTQAPNTHPKRIRHMQQFVDACLQTDPLCRPTVHQLHHCTYIRHIKRKLKEKGCALFSDLLKPLTPISHEIDQSDGGLFRQDILAEMMAETRLSCEGDGWVF